MHTWHIIFLGSYLVLLFVRFSACRDLHDKPRFTENGFRKKKLVAFSVLEVLLVLLYREIKPFPIWFYIPLLDNDVSLHIFVVLVVVISTSQIGRAHV